jgi:D-apiose dehydrogenase
MGDVLRVGLIGAGDISQYHLRAWARLGGDAAVVAVCDRDGDRAKARAAEFGIAASYADADAMLDNEELDAVDIATTRETHVPLCLLAADHGLAILCQKPLAPSLAEAESLVDAIADSVRLMVHENRRFAPHFRVIREWIADGRIGAVRQVVMTTYRGSLIAGPDGRRPGVERAAYYATEPRLLIGEALIHQLDVLRFLLGPLQVVAARSLHTEPDLPGETVASLLLETSGRAQVTLAGSYVAPGYAGGPAPAGAASSGAALGAQTSDRLEIAGSVASIVMAGETLELRGPAEHEALPVDFAATYQTCFDEAIAHFVRCLSSGEPFETEPADNLETLRLVDAAYRSADAT